ncbi:MAG: Arm DNA-binding domain-containing protein [Flavobacteriaceae bacterium]
MTLGFVFKGVRKDGTYQLYIRFKDGKLKRNDNDVRIKIEGVYIFKKLWNKTFSQVSPDHPNSEVINNKIIDYKAKMLEVQNKYNIGQIDFDTAKRMLSNKESAKSIKEYIL